MDDTERQEVAISAANLLKARQSRAQRREDLQAIIEVLHSEVVPAHVVNVLRDVLDAEYVFRNRGED